MFLMAVVLAGGLAFMVVIVSTKEQFDSVSAPVYNYSEVFFLSLFFFFFFFFVVVFCFHLHYPLSFSLSLSLSLSVQLF